MSCVFEQYSGAGVSPFAHASRQQEVFFLLAACLSLYNGKYAIYIRDKRLCPALGAFSAEVH